MKEKTYPMLSPLQPNQKSHLTKRATQHGLSNYTERLLSLAQNCVQLSGLAPDQDKRVGQCRLGGLPDVPKGFVWPDGMAYAQEGPGRAAVRPRSGVTFFVLTVAGQ